LDNSAVFSESAAVIVKKDKTNLTDVIAIYKNFGLLASGDTVGNVLVEFAGY
jgi:hypothetical protein